jgi:predicted secreted protein
MTQQIKDEKRREGRLNKRASSTDNLINFKRVKTSVRLMMKKAKKEAWCISSINEKTSSQEMWDKVRQLLGKRKAHQLKRLKDPNSEIITDPKAMANLLTDERTDNTLKLLEKEKQKKKRHKCPSTWIPVQMDRGHSDTNTKTL